MSKTKMLNKTITTTLITLVTLSILLAAIPMANAAITLGALDKLSGPCGTNVLVSGTGASLGGLVEVYWENLAGSKLNETYATGGGVFACYVIIPEGFSGAHWIIAKDVIAGITAAASFIITPTLTLTQTSGIVGDTVNVTGTGFNASSIIGLFFNSTVKLIQSSTNTATWYNDTTATGTPNLMDVVKLFANDVGTDARAAVLIPNSTVTLDTFSPALVSFQYNGTIGHGVPYLELRFIDTTSCLDPDGKSHVDITFTPQAQTIAASGQWYVKSPYSDTSQCVAYGTTSAGAPFSHLAETWTHVVAAVKAAMTDSGSWNLTRIAPQVGYTDVLGTYYVDGVKYDTTYYDLEPAYKNVTSTALGSITTDFVVPSTFEAGINKVSAINETDVFAYADFTLGPAITLSPTTGPSGTAVTITGRGFAATTAVTPITIGGHTAPIVGTITTLAGGTFTGQFIVPTHAIEQNLDVMATVGAKNAHATFNVTGTTAITLTPTAGPVSQVVTIAGANFTAIAGKAVTVTFNGASVATLSTNATGGFSGTFIVPSIGAAEYDVNATEVVNGLNATTHFTIAVTFLSITPVIGPTGTLATVTGYGFTGISHNVTIGTLRVVTNLNILDGETFFVPTLPVGTYTVTALDSALLTASTTYQVNATTAVTLTSSSAIAGANVTLDASSFTAALTALTFTFKNATYTPALIVPHVQAWTGTDQTTNTTGYYMGSFIVPSLSVGSYTINATDANGLTVEVPFSIVLAVPTITLSPTESLIGAVVNVTGTTFGVSTAVNIYFGSTLVKTVNSTAGGALPSDANFTVPDVSYGTYTVTASDGVNSATATFNVLGVHGIDTIQTMVAEIEAKLDQYGSFWNFTNTWFTTISNKLGVFTAPDTVASLLYDIRTRVIAINFTSIDNKLGTFTGTDTVASLLYSIKTSVSTINWTDITAIKAKTDTINWADITSIKSTTSLSIDYLWGLQDHPLWGLRTKVVPMLESIKNATQFTAGAYSTIMPTSAAPVNLGKSSKVTLTVRATDDATEGFVIKAYIYDGTAWRPLSFSAPGIASSDCAATVQFNTGTDGKFYFETTGATFTAFIYTAESAP